MFDQYPAALQGRLLMPNSNFKNSVIYLNFLLFLSLVTSLHSNAENHINIDRDLKDKICETSIISKVDSRVVIGVFLAEKYLNKNFVDNVQDYIFQSMLQTMDEVGWDKWVLDGMSRTESLNNIRMIANKWPVDVKLQGFVMSIGPFQITPRTALLACRGKWSIKDECPNSVHDLIKSMLSFEQSPRIAVAVLKHEANEIRMAINKDITNNIPLWATVYNVGSDYYLYHKMWFDAKPNRFGKWILSHMKEIEMLAKCEH